MLLITAKKLMVTGAYSGVIPPGNVIDMTDITQLSWIGTGKTLGFNQGWSSTGQVRQNG